MACQASLSRGFSRKEYWSILANTGCHTLLEHYISCSPRCQLPLVVGAARIPVTQAAAPPPHLALTGANPSHPEQPQEQTPVDDPHAEVKIKPQLKPRGSCGSARRPKTFLPAVQTSYKIYAINQEDCVYGIYKRTLRPPLAILILACASSSPAFRMMYSV